MKAQKLCCYCEFWKLSTENGKTGWCNIQKTWKNWRSTCKDCNIEE